MSRKPNSYYMVLVMGAIVRLHNLNYSNLQAGEVFTMLVRLGLLREDDRDAHAAVRVAFEGDAAKKLRRMLAKAQQPQNG